MLKSLSYSSAIIALSTSAIVSSAHAQDGDDLVFVTGSPFERTSDNTTIGQSVIDREEITRSLEGTLGETLRREPGVSSTSFGPGASRPIIRGQGGNRVRVLSNGIGSIDASAASPDHAVAVEPALADRIEIVRGSALLRYGSSAAGGVVNVFDNRIPQEAPEDDVEGAARVGLSTVDEGYDAAGGVTATIGTLGGVDIVGHVSGSWRESNDIDIPGFAESARFIALEEAEGEEEGEEEEEAFGTLENSSVDSQTFSGGLSFIGERGMIGFSVKDTESLYGIPGGHGHEEEEGEEEEEEEEEAVTIDLDQIRYDVNARLNLDGEWFENISLYAGYADYTHTEFEGPGEVGTVFTNEGWEARIELLGAERNGWRGAYGLQLRDREFAAIGEEAFVPPTETSEFGLYTFQELRTGDFLLEGAVRYERTEHTSTTDAVDLDFDGISVSVGAAYDLTDAVTLSGNLFRTERAPGTEELFSNGPHLATDRFEVGDATLDKEIGTGIEAILQFQTEKGFIAFNVFHTDYQDYIFEQETADEEDDLPIFLFTAADATFTGLEIEGGVTLCTCEAFSVTADGVFDLVDAEFDDGGNLPLIPPMGATLGINADGDRFSLRGEVEYAAEQDDTADFELGTDSYTSFNAYASVAPFADAPNLRLRVAGINLSDEDIRQHTSFLKDLAPAPGRNVRVSLTYDF